MNSKGWSVLSLPNTIGVVAQTAPTSAPSNFTGISTLNSIDLTWNNLLLNSDTGYNQVTSYEIYWDEGFGGSLTYLNTTTTNVYSLLNLNNAITFTFKIRGINLFGQGPFTSSISIETIGPPDKMNEVTVIQSGTQVTIQWQIPPSNGGQIDSFQIMLLN